MSDTFHLQADKLQTIIKAAKVDDVEPIWTTLFAKVGTQLALFGYSNVVMLGHLDVYTDVY